MLYLLHGDHLVASRNYLNSLVNRHQERGVKEIIRLDGKKISLTELISALESQSFFGSEKLVIIENLFARPKSKFKDQLLSYLKTTSNLPSCIIWEAKSLPQSIHKQFPSAEVKEFKTPTLIFKFTDSLKPDNQKQLISLYQQCLQVDSAETVFYMLARHLRLLIQSTDPGFKAPPWQITKLRNQYQALGESVIINLHHQLLTVDERLKTSRSSLGLTGELDLILAKL